MLTRTNTISNMDDIIDSRDVTARIEELRDIEERDDDENDELAALEAFAEEANGSPDWQYGETLIRDSYFKEYAQELAEECGMIPADLKWPCNCIDWDQAVRELKYDYMGADFSGVTYWLRA